MIGRFDEGQPESSIFRAFLRDAEKFRKDASGSGKVEAILVVSSEKIDKKFLSEVTEDASKLLLDLIEYKVIGQSREAPKTRETAGVTPAMPSPPSVPSPSVSSGNLDFDSISRALPSPSEKERILYAWEVLPEKPLGTGQTILCATQERGLLMRRVGDDYLVDVDFRWETISDPKTEIDPGGTVLRLYDGGREHRLRSRDGQFIQVLFHHLKWAREGFVSGYMNELGFDPDLVRRTSGDYAAGRFSDAVRTGFALLETRVRSETLATPDLVGEKLADYAFHPESGKLPLGATSAEKQGVHLLFRGAFLAFRNPVAHQDGVHGLGRAEATSQLALVNLLLDLTRKAKENFQRGMH
jgi:hypothetical protein